MIVSREERAATIDESGYVIEEQFIVPEDAWLKNYYEPIAERLKILDAQYGDDEVYNKAATAEREEAYLYRKYKDYYGYVFYVCRLST